MVHFIELFRTGFSVAAPCNLWADMQSQCPHDVRFGSKADMCAAKGHVRFTHESGHSTAR
jgi:hypothetical protein